MANLAQLKRLLHEGRIERCYLLAGEDGYIRQQAYNAVKKAVALCYEELNLTLFTGDNIVTNDLAAALTMLPFLSEKRLVVAKEYYPKADEVALLDKQYFSADFTGTVFVIINGKGTDAFKKVASRLTRIDCPHPDIPDAVRWISRRFEMAKLTISAQNARLIAEYCLCDMTRICIECDKLASYTAGGAEITKQDIDAVVVRESEYEIYELTGAIATKDRTRAFRILQTLLDKKQNEQLLLMAMYSHFRRMLFTAIGKTNRSSLAEMLGVKEFAVSKAAEQARLFSPKSLKKNLDIIAGADFLNKSGGMAAPTALQYVVLELINS